MAAENAFDRIQHQLMIKNLKTIKNERKVPQVKKNAYKKIYRKHCTCWVRSDIEMKNATIPAFIHLDTEGLDYCNKARKKKNKARKNI